MKTISYMSRGEDVKRIQVLVNGLTPITPPLFEDGVFGAKTLAGVKLLQASIGAVVDGVVGPETLSKATFAAIDFCQRYHR